MTQDFHDRVLEEHLELYLEHLLARHCTPETVRHRRYNLMRFVRFCSDAGVHHARNITPEFLMGFIKSLKKFPGRVGRFLAGQTVDAHRIALSSFFAYLAKRRLVLFNPAKDLPRAKSGAALVRGVLTAMQAEVVLSKPDTETARGIRDRSMMELLYDTGMRRAELAGLLVSDIDFEKGTIFIRQGKNRKDRVVPCGERAVLWIRKYLSEARNSFVRHPDGGLLFLNKNGKKIRPDRLTLAVTQYRKMAGIEKPGSCHMFRHTAATLMIENGADVRHVQELLGHESPDTTQIYTRVSVKRLREIHERFHPAVFEMSPPAAESTSPAGGRIRKGRGWHPKRSTSLRSSFQQLLKEYLGSMEADGYAPETRNGNALRLEKFLAWCEKERVFIVSRIDTDLLLKYQKRLTELRKKNGDALSIKSQFADLFAVRLFCRWAFRNGRILYDPSDALELPRIPKNLPGRILSAEEAERVLANCDTGSLYGLRLRAMLEILYATGIRASELVNLKMKDIDFENRSLFIHSTKTGSDRIIPAGSRGIYWLQRYIADARALLAEQNEVEYVFVTSAGKKIHGRQAGLECRKQLRACGIEKGSLHIFRHTLATLLLENGADIRSVQEMLGHRELRTTQLYTQVSIRKLKEVHAKTHPGEIRFREGKERREREQKEAQGENGASDP